MKKALALLLIALSSYAHADGNALLDDCALSERPERTTGGLTKVEYMRLGICIGNVEGVRETMTMHSTLLPPEAKVCLPAQGISNGQAIRIALKYLRENPEVLHQNRSLLLLKAFHEAFPCPKS